MTAPVVLPSVEPAPAWLLPWLSLASAACVLLLLVGFPPLRSDAGGFLPALNAGLNLAATVCLLTGYRFIRRGHVPAHRRSMLFALGLSAVFLACYLLHHAAVGSVRYIGPPALKTLYLAILLPHIALAAAVVPLALVTVFRGLKDRRPAHRRLARITLPIWLYVSVSGVVVYFMVYRLV